MKTDRELLELAAKAAGVEIEYWAGECPRVRSGFPVDWNPLTDDGDALRLAVALHFDVDIDYDGACVICADVEGWTSVIAHDGDVAAATRRAIVRAAAAIGEVVK